MAGGSAVKVAHTGNLANDGYATVKALRDQGVDAELLINLAGFGMGLPHWEMYEVEGDPYDMEVSKLTKYKLPDWIKIYSNTSNQMKSAAALFRMSRNYDLIHCHFPTYNYLQFGSKPYIIYEAGFLRKIYNYVMKKPTRKNWAHLGLRAFENAAFVTWTNTDMRPMLNAIKVKRERFVPFAIDTERYTPPAIRSEHKTLQFLHPTRQIWDIKSNDKMLRAFVRFVKKGFDAHLTLVDWGYQEDVRAAKEILSPVSDRVTWVPPMNKPALIRAYQSADAVLDQFMLGASGTVGFEAMSCGTPLMIYFSDSARECFDEEPPCVNVKSEEEIFLGFEKLMDESFRKRLGYLERDFVKRHLSEEIVAKILKSIYKESLS